MFIKKIVSEPRIVEGRRFVEETIVSKFKKGQISIRTTYMDGKPLLKQYELEDRTLLKNVWKSMKKGHETSEMVLDKTLNIIV